MISAAPLAELLRRRVDQGMEIRQLDRQIMTRFGGQPDSWKRNLIEILNGRREKIRVGTADKITIALGLSMVELWGDEYLTLEPEPPKPRRNGTSVSRHGTISRYNNQECRCRRCTNANTEYHRRRRQRDRLRRLQQRQLRSKRPGPEKK